MWNFIGGMRISQPMNNINTHVFFCQSKGNLSLVHGKSEEHVGDLLTGSSESVSKTKRSNEN